MNRFCWSFLGMPRFAFRWFCWVAAIWGWSEIAGRSRGRLFSVSGWRSDPKSFHFEGLRRSSSGPPRPACSADARAQLGVERTVAGAWALLPSRDAMAPAASPAFSLIAILGSLITIYAVLVESQNEPTVQISPPPPLLSPPPPPPPPPPPSPPLPPPPPPPLPLSPPPPSPPPPAEQRGSPPPPHIQSPLQSERRAPPPPRPHKHEINTGKKVGLLFVGIAAILQIAVAGFLVYRRRQLLKAKDRFPWKFPHHRNTSNDEIQSGPTTRKILDWYTDRPIHREHWQTRIDSVLIQLHEPELGFSLRELRR